MPRVFKRHMDSVTLALWHITESEEELASLVAERDRGEVARHASVRRRREKLAWRALLRSLRPDATVRYDAMGAPVPDMGCMGVSHSGDYAAVVLSDRPCAVDMERGERDFSRAAPRYITAAEASLPGSGDPLFRAVVWCTKETLYKLSGRPGLDLLEDIAVSSVDMAAGVVVGHVGDNDPVAMSILMHDGYVVVHTVY